MPGPGGPAGLAGPAGATREDLEPPRPGYDGHPACFRHYGQNMREAYHSQVLVAPEPGLGGSSANVLSNSNDFAVQEPPSEAWLLNSKTMKIN